MPRLVSGLLMAVAVALCAAPASAKISAMSGAYDGRGKTPEKVTGAPKKPKKSPRNNATPQGGN